MGNTARTISNDPDVWDDLDRLNTNEFYPDDRYDQVNFEAIIWKRSQQSTETIGTIWGFPRNQQSYSSNREKKSAWTPLRSKKNLKQKCSHRVWALFEKKSPLHQVLDVTSLCLRGILLARLRRKIERKSGLQDTSPQSLSLKSRFLFPFSISYECFV